MKKTEAEFYDSWTKSMFILCFGFFGFFVFLEEKL